MDSPIHVYLDLDIINNADPSVNTDPPVLHFEEIRNTPFIDNTEDYFCSIIRFSIQSGSILPLFLPRIQIGQTDPNQTVYVITLAYTYTLPGPVVQRVEVSLPISYTPNNSQPTPLPPLKQQDLSTSYYYLQSYQDFVNMINSTLKTLWANMNTAIQSTHPTLPANIPFVLFNPDDGKFVIQGDSSYFSEAITSGVKVELWFNTRLFELMSGFPCYIAGPTGNKNYRILFINNYDTNVQQISYTDSTNTTIQYSAIQVFQEISTISMWNPVASVVFSSSMLPVQSTNISPPKVFNDSNLSSTGNNAGVFNILTDFEVPYSALNQYRPNIDYTPSGDYRLLDMNSIRNLNRIDIDVYWKTHMGEYIRFKLQPGCSAHIKLMFRHRSFYLGL